MPTIILLGITWTGCNSTAAIIWWILLGATSVATVSSAGVSVLDIAPNHTGNEDCYHFNIFFLNNNLNFHRIYFKI